MEGAFIEKITAVISENISDERFGVYELSAAIGMSRSNLLRKIKSATGLSASQFIRRVRLEQAMELLRESEYTVSEVSYRVGFNSISYFIKCFHDHYGYPPGEAPKHKSSPEEPGVTEPEPAKPRLSAVVAGTVLLLIISVFVIMVKPFSTGLKELEKSIAVLPFKNDSNDSSNIYIINGLMEALLSDLQNISQLRVISRTSVEKYRNHNMSIPEIAKELNVSYFVEGSGQKIGDQLMLNIQLIEAETDRHLWAQQYLREASDIFELQAEVAKSIAENIEVIITPEEVSRIEKVPTENLEAYDLFMKGYDLLYTFDPVLLSEAIDYFEQAIELDKQFARAHSAAASAYYFLDFNQADKKYADEINYYADRALLLDPTSPQSLIVKAIYYYYTDDKELAIPYLEKAHEYNPSSALAINILSDYYANVVPNPGKYLEYALEGIKLNPAANDSITTSFIYMHLSNAFIQSGFISEAEYYVNKAFDFYPNNIFAARVEPYVVYARTRDLQQLNADLLEVLRYDHENLDLLQEVGKSYYFMREYELAWEYYSQYFEIANSRNIDIHPAEDIKIARVARELGMTREAELLAADFKAYAEADNSIYRDLNLAVYHAYQGETETAIEYMRSFTSQEEYFIWIILFYELDPNQDEVRDHPDYRAIMDQIESTFWNRHRKIRNKFQEEGLI